MTDFDFAVFQKTTTKLIDELDQVLTKLKGLIEELDPDSDRAADADTAIDKMSLQYIAVKEAFGKIKEEDCFSEEEEEEESEEEEEDETEST